MKNRNFVKSVGMRWCSVTNEREPRYIDKHIDQDGFSRDNYRGR